MRRTAAGRRVHEEHARRVREVPALHEAEALLVGALGELGREVDRVGAGDEPHRRDRERSTAMVSLSTLSREPHAVIAASSARRRTRRLRATANRAQHVVANETAPGTHDQPVEPEGTSHVRRTQHTRLRSQLGHVVAQRVHGEAPAGERRSRRRTGAKRLSRHVGAQVAARRPESADQSDHELVVRTLGDDAEAGTLEIGEPHTTARLSLAILGDRGAGCAEHREQRGRHGAKGEQRASHRRAREVRFADRRIYRCRRGEDARAVPLDHVVPWASASLFRIMASLSASNETADRFDEGILTLCVDRGCTHAS